jgi:quercetin dioxygenase-like cupin family protein
VEGDDGGVFGGVTWRTLISADRTPTSALTAGLACVPAGESGPAGEHRHPVAELYFVLAGRGVLSVGGVEHELRAGDAVSIPPDVWHVARNTGRDGLRILYVFATSSFADVVYTFRDQRTTD